jgi:hypothetical protein
MSDGAFHILFSYELAKKEGLPFLMSLMKANAFMLCHIGNGKGYIRLQNVKHKNVGTQLQFVCCKNRQKDWGLISERCVTDC